MKPFKKIAGLNLAILLAYSLVIDLGSRAGNSDRNEGPLGAMILSAFAVGMHVLIGAVLTSAKFARDNREEGRAWLASTGLVLLVGFSVCLGNTAL